MDDLIFQHDGLVFDHAEAEFETLKEFLSISTQNIVNEYAKYVDFHNKQQKDYPVILLDDLYNQDYIDFYLENIGKHGRTYPRLLYYSIIIVACSLFESNMRLIYKSMNHFKRTELQWDSIRGNVMQKTVKLLKNIDLRLKDEKDYLTKFYNYYRVRNCIVHHNGLINEYRDRIKLLKYATEFELVSEAYEEPILELSDGYCEEVCDTFGRFFLYLSLDYRSENK